MSLKGMGVFTTIGLLLWGLVHFTRSPMPQAEADVAAVDEKTAVAEPALSLPQARRSAGRIERASEGSFKRQFAQVDALVRAGQGQEAFRLLEEILQKDPKQERALEEMGMLQLTEFQDADKAAYYFKKALSSNPNNEFAVMELVGISLSPQKAAAMADYLRGLYESHPTSPVLADGLGELYLSQGRFSDAVSYLEKSAQDAKYAEFAFTRLASVYEQMGDGEKAADFYRKAIDRQGAELARRQGEGQVTDLLEADQARSQLDLAHLYVKERRCDEAQEMVEKARRRLGDDFEVQALADQIQRDGCAG